VVGPQLVEQGEVGAGAQRALLLQEVEDTAGATVEKLHHPVKEKEM